MVRVKSKTQVVIVTMAAISTILGVLFIVLYQFEKNNLWLTLAITFCTTAYHFDVRLLIKSILEKKKDCVSLKGIWFRISPTEMKFYHFIRVKKWKGKLPTYTPDNFNLHKHSLEEILQNMYVADLIHVFMFLASYVSLLFCFITPDWRSSFWIFFVTGTGAALVEVIFVILQRFNRGRLLLILQDGKKRNQKGA